MPDNDQQQEFNPFQSYLMIGAGACLVAIRFLGDTEVWQPLDFVKVGVGAAMIGYGIYRLVKKK